MGDHAQPVPKCRQLEHPAHYGCFTLVDPALDVPLDAHVVVSEDAPAGDVAGARLAQHGVTRPLPRLLAFQLGRECRQREHHLVDGGVELSFAIVEVEEHAHAGFDDLAEDRAGLVHFAAEARFLAHDQHVERWTRFQGV